jgi:hypothetical protein
MKAPVVENKVSSGLFVGLVLGSMGIASGCDTITEKLTQKVTESAIEHVIEQKTGGDVQIDSNNGAVTVKSDKGTVAFNSAGGKVPEDWPSDVPLYPGAKVTMSMSNAGQHVLSLETTDTPEQAVEFYKSKLSALKQEGTMATEQQTMIAYKDETGRRVQLAIGKDQGGSGNKTTIALIIHAAKKPKK